MRAKSRVLRRINLLYTLFFAAIVLAVVASVMSDDFRTGLRDGQQAARVNMAGVGMPIQLYGVDNRTSALPHYDIPLASTQSGVEANAKIETFSVQITGLPSTSFFSWDMLTALLSMLCYAFIFVLIFVILRSLHRSFRSGDVFERRIIRFTKTIGKVLVAASVLGSLSAWLNNCTAARLLAASEHVVVDTTFAFSHSEIIMAILIMFIAEVFAIGYEMTEEQKLTI